MSLYAAIARPLLFKIPPETAHEMTMALLGATARVLGRHVPAPPGRPVRCLGLEFPNPVGLAAGMDKNATALPVWPLLGFGHVEVGTVTALAQPGNPKPRLYRLPAQRALINRMGFNNDGAAAMAARLLAWRASGRWPRVPVGINLGKSKVTPLEQAAEDYAESFRLLRDFGDYFVVNVSSPNTPGLRELQAADHLLLVQRSAEIELETVGDGNDDVMGPVARQQLGRTACGTGPTGGLFGGGDGVDQGQGHGSRSLSKTARQGTHAVTDRGASPRRCSTHLSRSSGRPENPAGVGTVSGGTRWLPRRQRA